jgi:hypothetical protein
VLGSAEVRLYVARLILVVPTDFGVTALTDVGRVFLDGDPSDRWHSSWGGGIWFAPLSRGATLHLTVVRAAERTSLLAGIGFPF